MNLIQRFRAKFMGTQYVLLKNDSMLAVKKVTTYHERVYIKVSFLKRAARNRFGTMIELKPNGHVINGIFTWEPMTTGMALYRAKDNSSEQEDVGERARTGGEHRRIPPTIFQ